MCESLRKLDLRFLSNKTETFYVSVTHLILRLAIVQNKFQQVNKTKTNHINDNRIKFKVSLHFSGIWPIVCRSREGGMTIYCRPQQKQGTNQFLSHFFIFIRLAMCVSLFEKKGDTKIYHCAKPLVVYKRRPGNWPFSPHETLQFAAPAAGPSDRLQISSAIIAQKENWRPIQMC